MFINMTNAQANYRQKEFLYLLFRFAFIFPLICSNTLNNNNLLNSKNKGSIIKLQKIISYERHLINMNFLAEMQQHLGNNFYDKFILSSHLKQENLNNELTLKTRTIKNIFLQTNTNNLKSISKLKISSLQTKVIPLKNFKNTQYLGNIKIGEPSQEIPVIFDTGSGNLWVTSSLCRSLSCRKTKSYNRHKSKKFRKLGLGVEVTFGTGMVSGEINSDMFNLGNITIPNQKFAEILEQRGNVFDSGRFSGILGLGYPAMSAYNSVPVFDTIIKDKLLNNNIMAFYYSYNENTEGEVSLGFVNPARYIGKLDYFDVIDKYYWTIKLDDILYDGKSLGLCENGCKAIADTGTTLLTGPTPDVRKLLAKIPVENDCKNYEKTGKLEFIFSGVIYELKLDEYIGKTDDGNGKVSCSALIMPLDVPVPHGPAWILGGTFLQKYYSVYDRDNDKVGFALATHKEEKKSYD